MVQRYTLVAPGVLNTDMNTGSWVRYSDYQKLEAELEQLRQQVKRPADDGWIEWGGGECPVASSALVEVKFVDGYQAEYEAGLVYWGLDNGSFNIAAYRVVKP